MRLRFDLVLAVVVTLAPLAGTAQPEAPLAAGEVPSRPEVRKAGPVFGPAVQKSYWTLNFQKRPSCTWVGCSHGVAVTAPGAE